MNILSDGKMVRYAVIGLGHIAQVAVLPSFVHAKSNSILTGLISGDNEKLAELSKKYKIEHTWSYDQFDEAVKSGYFDALYIALPNSLHAEYAVKAAEAGVHVLCEKPMAVTEDECLEMVAAAKRSSTKLMIAYRLHFEEANMKIVELIQTGEIGEARIFNSTFTMQVRQDNIRTKADLGGGPLYDIGIYCINAARYIFQAEPIEVISFSSKSPDERFDEISEMNSVMMRFPGDKLASFVCSFGAADCSSYQVVGTKGEINMSPAYDYTEILRFTLKKDGKEHKFEFPKRDQFAPELIHFSNCILEDDLYLPDGYEGLADVRIICALKNSAEQEQIIELEKFEPVYRPSMQQVIKQPPVHKPALVNAQSGSQ